MNNFKSGPEILKKLNAYSLSFKLVFSFLICLVYLLMEYRLIVIGLYVIIGLLTIASQNRTYHFLKENKVDFILISKKERRNEILQTVFVGIPLLLCTIWVQFRVTKYPNDYFLLSGMIALGILLAFMLKPRWKLLIKDNFLIYPGSWKNKGLVLTNEVVISSITKDKHELVQGETRIELAINEMQAEDLRKIITKNS